VPKVAKSGKNHTDTEFIAGRYALAISLGTTRLDDGDNTMPGSFFDRIPKRNEPI